jgi:hypothetical protein
VNRLGLTILEREDVVRMADLSRGVQPGGRGQRETFPVQDIDEEFFLDEIG